MSLAPSRPQRVLVSGGRGRLASLIADHLRAPQHEVTLFSRNATAGFKPLADLTRADVLGQADALLHLAWSSLPATSEQNPGCERKEDLPLLEKILLASAALPAARRPLFVFFSSGGTVYGNAPGRPSREADSRRPIGCYGRAKQAAEEMIEDLGRRHELPFVILRVSNPYGYPVPSGRVQGIIPHAIRSAATGAPLTLWGDGHAQKDFLYYTDFLSAVDEVVTRRLTGTYNISAGESHRVDELIAKVERHIGKKISLTSIPPPSWDVQDSRLDNGLFVATTGWRPQVGLDEGIRRAAAGFLDR